MTAEQQPLKFANKHNIVLKPKKVKEVNPNSTKIKDLTEQMLKVFGYITE